MSPPQISDKEMDVSSILMDCKMVETTKDVANNLPEPIKTDLETDAMIHKMSECEKSEFNAKANISLSDNEKYETNASKTNDVSNTKVAENITSSLAALTTQETKVNIATIVFFDLETTGLAKTCGKKNVQITEISMIAVGRNDFCKCSYPDLRDVRVIQKLSLCIRPRCPVSREASCITGNMFCFIFL